MNKRVVLAIGLLALSGCGTIQRYEQSLDAQQQAYQRSQKLLDEQNAIQVNGYKSQQTDQLIKQARAQAQIKVEEAKGIAEAQKIIDGTLTPLYLQHEAIQAQQEAAKNGDHTSTIYIPSGMQGIPIPFADSSHANSKQAEK